MYIKESKQTNKKTGKVYSYYQLVETIHIDGKRQQRVVLQLGKLDLDRQELRLLAKILELKILGKPCVLKFSEKLEQIADNAYFRYQQKEVNDKHKNMSERSIDGDYVSVDLRSIEHSHYRFAGAEIVGLKYWKDIKFENVLRSLGFKPRECIYAQVAILGRLISPGSELHTLRWVNKQSSLLEYNSHRIDHVPKEPFYLISDKLLEYKQDIEARIRQNVKVLYPIVDRVYLYDLTNTYFESSKENSTLCKRGNCKSKRYDCPLVTLALVVDQDGFVVLSKIYKGNQSEPPTLPEVLSQLFNNSDDIRDQIIKPSLVMDRGIATKENIDYMKANGYSYFIIERRDTVSDFALEFDSDEDFEEYSASGNERIYLRKINKDGTVFVLVRSTGKTKKEQAITDFKHTRFMKDVKRLIDSNRRGYIKEEDKINRRLGRLFERNKGTDGRYEFNLAKDSKDSSIVKSIVLIDKGGKKSKEEHPGCYVIQTDHNNLTSKEIWDFYMQLSEVEASFRSLKSELGTRPVFHQKDDRIESHLFISVLAYTILKCITYELKQSGYHKRWSEIRQILKTHLRSTSILTSNDGYRYHVRVTGNPEKEASEIYKLLKVKIKPFRKINRCRK